MTRAFRLFRFFWRLWVRLLPVRWHPLAVPYWRYLHGFCIQWLSASPEERAGLCAFCFQYPGSRYRTAFRLVGSLTVAFALVLRWRDAVDPRGDMLRANEREGFATASCPAGEVTVGHIAGGAASVLSACGFLPSGVGV